jgi:hypothetical protein
MSESMVQGTDNLCCIGTTRDVSLANNGFFAQKSPEKFLKVW